MGRISKVEQTPEDDNIAKAIADSNLWVLITVTAHEEGATVAVRESVNGATIDTIAMLLEQKEIYDQVEKRIAEVKLKLNKQDKSSNTNIN